ncbi:ATP synthase F1 subunit epsilon [bacterium]|nr:ATP synthase F1 subunit epsilon [bacterium]
MHTGKNIRCVVVTPERTVLDREANLVVVPSFDGEIGILAGHAPTLARLAAGELRVSGGPGSASYFVEGGFAQVQDDVVTVLTSRVRTLKDLDPTRLETELSELSLTVESSFSAEGQKIKNDKMNAIRAALRLARREK